MIFILVHQLRGGESAGGSRLLPVRKKARRELKSLARLSDQSKMNQPTRMFITQRETIAVMIGIAMMSGMREPLMPMTPRQRPMY